MTRLIWLILLTIAAFNIWLVPPLLADEPVNGAKTFSAYCAACHAGGGNVIIANKTLKKPVLEKYNMLSVEAIVSQLQDGKNAMPSFKGRLTDQQMKDLAAYVLDKAENGW